MHPTERTAVRQAAIAVGAVALASVVVKVLTWGLWEVLVVGELIGPAGPGTRGALQAVTGGATVVSTTVAPLVAILLAFYLTAGRDLPALPVAAGAFVGAMVAPVGHVLADVLVFGQTDPLPVIVTETSLVWTTWLLVPVLLAVLFGAVIDDVWERGRRFRGVRS